MSHLDNIDDLNAAAMIDKTFYGAYRRNEASLLKNVMKAERRRTMSQANPDGSAARTSIQQDVLVPRQLDTTSSRLTADSTSLSSENPRPSVSAENIAVDDIYEVSPSLSPVEEMSHEEAHRILWGDEQTKDAAELQSRKGSSVNIMYVERNEKCLVADLAHIEDKARIGEDDGKHLRIEKGLLVWGPSAPDHEVY